MRLSFLPLALTAACAPGAPAPEAAPAPSPKVAPAPAAPTEATVPPAIAHLRAAEQAPGPAAEALLAMENVSPQMWGAYLLAATGLDPKRAYRVHRERFPQEKAARTPADLLLRARLLSDEVGRIHMTEGGEFVEHDTDGVVSASDVPCWMATRWPADWAAAFGSYYGSTRDIGAVPCAPDLGRSWLTPYDAVTERALGPKTWCGTMSEGLEKSGDTYLFSSWFDPRSLLDPASTARTRKAGKAAREDLQRRTGWDEARVAAFLAEADAAPADWRIPLEERLRTTDLTEAERAAVIVNLKTHLETLALEVMQTCSYANEPG
jgi:hypothetical protein